jgi:hypothetical protein
MAAVPGLVSLGQGTSKMPQQLPEVNTSGAQAGPPGEIQYKLVAGRVSASGRQHLWAPVATTGNGPCLN